MNSIVKNIGSVILGGIIGTVGFKLLDKAISYYYENKWGNLAMFDKFTGLYNSNWLHSKGESKYDAKEVYMAFIDMDNLKEVNDTCGHIMGDMYIYAFANTLKKNFNALSDSICRYGGDEFIIFTETDPRDKLNTLNNCSFGCAKKKAGENIFIVIEQIDNEMYTMKKKHHSERCEKKYN